MFRRSAKAEHSTQKNEAAQSELSASNDKLSGNNNIKGKRAVFSGLFGKSSKKETSVSAKEGEKRDFVSRVSHKLPLPLGVESHDQGSFTVNAESLANCDEKVGPLLQHEDLAESHNSKEEHCLFSILQTLPTTEDTSGEDSPPLHIKLLACNDNLLYLSYNSSKDNSEKLGARFCRSPKPALRFSVETDPLSEHSDLTDWSHNLFDNDFEKKPVAVPWELRANNDYRLSDCDAESDFEVKGQKDGDACGKIIQKKRAVSFRVKRTLPRMSKFSSHAQGSEQELITEDPMEMQEVQTNEECTFEVLPLEMAAYPTDVNSTETDEDAGLMDWWKTVEGWSEWNKTTNFREDEDELAFEAVADRVFMAARLFVSLFNQRGASLQCHIVELLALADTADSFHKKTVSAAVGGGVASVAGSIATITGLILAPFTFGTSTIVTAVGISVATAGSITSATANITDAVQSKMDRKKVEKMIQGYQDEIKDIRDCLEFMQEGMDTLQEWNFKEYSESVVNTGLSRNIKHVMKEGGRAGKALMINTERLISTVKVLGVAGGAAKAAKAVSITTGVMSALFLALDVFFLARDSNELHKGAKTKFASKIREVCKELQHGLLELNKVKTQLQKTMDGIEVEEYDNQGEEEEEENKYESDPVNLSLLEQELDQLEEKLDQKNREMNEKMNESKKDTIKKKKKDESNSEKENEIKNDKQNKK